jgi:hypothetical protein
MNVQNPPITKTQIHNGPEYGLMYAYANVDKFGLEYNFISTRKGN